MLPTVLLVGVVTTLAGSARSYRDGVGFAASFSNPSGICVSPSGDLIVSDSINNLIRKVSTSGKRMGSSDCSSI